MTANGALDQPLSEFLGGGDIDALMLAIASVGKPIAGRLARGALEGELGAETGGGDKARALDLFADQAIADALAKARVKALASEERQTPKLLDPEGRFLVVVNPLDGSSNLDVNLTVGTIFSVLAAPERSGGEAGDFLQPGHRQLAAGILVFGPRVDFVFTTGAGTHAATLDPVRGEFRMTRLDILVPEGKAEFAIDASNERHWPDPVRAYVEDCLMGETGPRAKEFNMRWIASLVADAFRIFVRGGVYLYPEDARAGHGRGRLRLLYEANPIAFLAEQAGGLATDGVNRVLDATPTELHARTPLIFGSIDKVDRIRSYFVEGHRSASRAPLFGKRGLLRG